MRIACGPGFERLLSRLVRRLAGLVINGEYTERGLARLTGISQPHLHHILSGKRSLTAQVADSFLANLGWSIGDLFTAAEMNQMLLDRRSAEGARVRIPVISGAIGPGSPFPDNRAVEDWLFVPCRYSRGLRRLFLVELHADPALPFALREAVFALVSEDEDLRLGIGPEAWYVLRWGGTGWVRRIRLEGDFLHVLGQEPLAGPAGLQAIPLAGSSVLSVVRGRLLWAGPDPREFDPFLHSGSGFPIATAS